jgi:hypothetical protein
MGIYGALQHPAEADGFRIYDFRFWIGERSSAARRPYRTTGSQSSPLQASPKANQPPPYVGGYDRVDVRMWGADVGERESEI